MMIAGEQTASVLVNLVLVSAGAHARSQAQKGPEIHIGSFYRHLPYYSPYPRASGAWKTDQGSSRHEPSLMREVGCCINEIGAVQ